MIRKVWYYASWTIIVAFIVVITIGSIAKDGLGPAILALVMIAAVSGIIIGKDDR